MGSLLSGVCFPTQDLARDVFCSSVHVTIASSSTMTTEYYCTNPVGSNGPNSYQLAVFQNAQQTGVSYGTYPAFPSCTYDGTLANSTEYFSLVLGFVIVVWAASQIKNKFWGNHEGI